MEAWELGVTELQSAYRRRIVSPSEVVQASLGRIAALDNRIGAFREVAGDRARAEAAELTEELARGSVRGPLHGIPVAIKELFDVEGLSGCYGSEVLIDRISPSDAEVVRRLRKAGAIVIGVSRAHEFGWGITTQHAHLGSTKNPWAPNRVPGGSSGGSAAALATGMVPLALGSDTGGSIRIPAGFCGVAGFKPTYGRVPKRGGVALAPSLDHPGPMGRLAADLGLALGVMAGFDVEDSSTFNAPQLSLALRSGGLKGLKVGHAPDLHLTSLSHDYERVFQRVLRVLEEAGAVFVEVSFPHASEIRPAFGKIQMAEAHHYHTRTLGLYPDRAHDYGHDVRRRLEMASAVTRDELLEAMSVRQAVRQSFDMALESVDVIVTPVSAGGPSTIEDPDSVVHEGAELPFRDLVMDYTVPQDLTGLPTAVISAGLDDDKIPVGVQFTAARYREGTALNAAVEVESLLGGSPKWPPSKPSE